LEIPATSSEEGLEAPLGCARERNPLGNPLKNQECFIPGVTVQSNHEVKVHDVGAVDP
jgi:hypothetical protein